MMSPSKADRDTAKQAVRRYSQALGNLARAWNALHTAEGHGDPRPGSPAATDAAFLADMCGDLYVDPGQSLFAVVSGRMAVAVDHLQGTSKLYVAADTGVHSVWATGRSYVEMLGIACWLTGPGLLPEQRLGRVINDRLVSLYGAQRFIDKLENPLAVVNDPTERVADLLALAEQLGYSVVTRNRRRVVDPGYPSYSDLVDGAFMPGLYSLSSAMTHGEIWTITHHQREVGPMTRADGRKRTVGRMTVSLDEYQMLAVYLQFALGKTVDRLGTYYGWDLSNFGTAYERARADVLKGPAIPPEIRRLLGPPPDP